MILQRRPGWPALHHKYHANLVSTEGRVSNGPSAVAHHLIQAPGEVVRSGVV